MPIADRGFVQQNVPGMLPARGRGLLGDHLVNGEAQAHGSDRYGFAFATLVCENNRLLESLSVAVAEAERLRVLLGISSPKR